ncbi:MAG: TetR/AcrR family transcriptional regulator C-terminal domain-containing protein [Clostridia bacterium]|nr:TetR/AcrR family transcriptional regulator C-terminal domain-containing protein [Clostridia bacterium]
MTKKLLKDAILKLMETRSLDKMTVTDICAAADVNRSTFYAHYEDVHQLLREIENDMLIRMPVLPIPYANQPDQQGMERLCEFLRYVQENVRLYRVMLVRRDGGVFFNRAVDTMMEAARQSGQAEDEQLMRYDCAYRLNGTIGIIRQWIEDGCQIRPEELGRIIWYRRVNAQIKK